MSRRRRKLPPPTPRGPRTLLAVNLQFATEWGGLETQTWDLFRGLRDRGWEIKYLGKVNCPLASRLTDEKFSTKKIPALPVPWSPSFPLARRLFETAVFFIRGPIFLARFYGAFFKLRRPGEPVLILSILEKVLLTPLARALGHRVIWGEHVGAEVNRALSANPFLKLLRGQTRARKNPAIPVSPSHENALALHRLGFRGNRVVENGINVENFSKIGRKPNPAKEIRIGFWGCLRRDKGVDFLIKGFSKIVENFPDARLEILGDGPEKSALRDLADRRGIREKVNFHPAVPAEKIPDFVAGLDIAVLPASKPESFGLTAAEGMAAGRATIVTRGCGIVENLTDHLDALVVRPRSQWAIARALAELLTDEKFRKSLGAEGQKTARREFSIAKMTRRWEEILRG